MLEMNFFRLDEYHPETFISLSIIVKRIAYQYKNASLNASIAEARRTRFLY